MNKFGTIFEIFFLKTFSEISVFLVTQQPQNVGEFILYGYVWLVHSKRLLTSHMNN